MTLYFANRPYNISAMTDGHSVFFSQNEAKLIALVYWQYGSTSSSYCQSAKATFEEDVRKVSNCNL